MDGKRFYLTKYKTNMVRCGNSTHEYEDRCVGAYATYIQSPWWLYTLQYLL